MPKEIYYPFVYKTDFGFVLFILYTYIRYHEGLSENDGWMVSALYFISGISVTYIPVKMAVVITPHTLAPIA